jgi:hypothetical protein
MPTDALYPPAALDGIEFTSREVELFYRLRSIVHAERAYRQARERGVVGLERFDVRLKQASDSAWDLVRCHQDELDDA